MLFLVLLQRRYLTKNYAAHSLEAMKELDGVLAQLAVSIHTYSVCAYVCMYVQCIPIVYVPTYV